MSEEKKHIKNIIENYKNLEKEIVSQLTYQWDPHGTTIGGYREEVWKGLFEKIVPKKFKVERSVFIIDSKENCSKEVDLAIYDEQYTPYIFQHGVLKFIPIEAVAAVVECKSSGLNSENLRNWTESILKLTTSQESITRLATGINYGVNSVVTKNRLNNQKSKCGNEEKEKADNIDNTKCRLNTQTSTTPIKILCHTPKTNFIGYKSGEEYFDIVIRAVSNEKERMNIDFKYNNLFQWYFKLNHAKTEGYSKKLDDFKIDKENEIFKLKEYSIKRDYEIKEENLSLLSFVFQFNQLLMLINNPIFFPHRSYVEMFNNYLKKDN